MVTQLANITFINRLRRQMSSFKPGTTTAADERAPLLNGGSSRSLTHVGRGHVEHHNHRSPVITFLIDSEHTPGLDSENLTIHCLAKTWHVTKVTLFSSMSMVKSLGAFPFC